MSDTGVRTVVQGMVFGSILSAMSSMIAIACPDEAYLRQLFEPTSEPAGVGPQEG